MANEFSAEPLLRAAAEGALVLTANRRLARSLRRLFGRWMVEAGRSAWPTPAIRSGDDWLQQTAEVLGEGWRLLSAPAARHLWERIVEAESAAAGHGLLQVAATARWAEDAHALLVEYRQEAARYPLTADHSAFLRWRSTFLETCRREGWLDRAALADAVLDALGRRALPLPPALWLTGFDDLPPRFRRLADAMAVRGAEVHEFSWPAVTSGQPVRVPCTDARDEARQAARWARRLLEEGEGEIGIIVPDLEGYRSLIERTFREEIDPAALVRPDAEEIRFNLSLGVPFDGQGAVAAALEILAAGFQLTLPQAGFLMRTPYLGGSLREAAERAGKDRRLRGKGQPVVLLRTLARGGEGGGRATPPRSAAFEDICRHLLKAAGERGKRLPGRWMREFADLLNAVGWPGERPLDSLDYQVVTAWRSKVLSQLAAFDPLSGPIERPAALSLLRRLSAETVFQPEGPESPVQVIGLLEAAGLRFRHLWVMGLHDGALPAPPRPNPFLPLPLQIAAGMPHADAGREADFARRVAGRLFAAAPVVVLSHPCREGDAVLLPSPLIRDLAVGEVPLAPSHAPAAVWQASAAAEEVADFTGPPLAPGEAASGGTAILKDQALCPFRAFARHRLGAAALEVPDIGLDAGERGSLLHKVLELFWQATGDQAALLAMDGKTLEDRLQSCIAAAVEDVYARRGKPAPEVLALERQRLLLLAREWLLEIEARRPPFSVLEEEKAHIDSFGGVEFSTRIDRVDRLADGSLAVLDYKTGQVEAADLVGERLLEPQLPVYALGRIGEGLAAVAFAVLRRGKCGFAGVAREAGLLPKVPAAAEWKKAQEAGVADWEILLARWREQLHALGRAFASGEAGVDPASPQKACRICDLSPLCRISEGKIMVREGGEE